MREHYNTDYTRGEIDELLIKIKACVQENKYTIALNDNRQENIAFIREYNLDSAKQKKILLSIKTDDFCYSLRNRNAGYEYEILYVFAPIVTQYDSSGGEEELSMYVKFNIINTSKADFLVVISFHRLNEEIKYLFK